MILNDAKAIFIHPSLAGGGIIYSNLDDSHKGDYERSNLTSNNKYINSSPDMEEYYDFKGKLYSDHILRRYFDDCFTGNRDDFFYFTIVRNPWHHSLSIAKQVMRVDKNKIPFTLENKALINKVVRDIYLTDKYDSVFIQHSYYKFMRSRNNSLLDYDYILYFEDIENDLKTLSQLSGLKFKEKLNITHKPIDYRKYLTTDNIDLIYQHRRLDCDLLGYDPEKGILFKNNQPNIDNKSDMKYKIYDESDEIHIYQEKVKKLMPIEPQAKTVNKPKAKVRVKNNNNNAIRVIM